MPNTLTAFSSVEVFMFIMKYIHPSVYSGLKRFKGKPEFTSITDNDKEKYQEMTSQTLLFAPEMFEIHLYKDYMFGDTSNYLDDSFSLPSTDFSPNGKNSIGLGYTVVYKR